MEPAPGRRGVGGVLIFLKLKMKKKKKLQKSIKKTFPHFWDLNNFLLFLIFFLAIVL